MCTGSVSWVSVWAFNSNNYIAIIIKPRNPIVFISIIISIIIIRSSTFYVGPLIIIIIKKKKLLYSLVSLLLLLGVLRFM